MKWKEAIIRVLEEKGVEMHYKDILEEIDNKGYKIDYNGKTTENSVNSILSRNKSLFECVGNGVYKLVRTPHFSAVGRTVPVVVRPSTAYAPGDSTYKDASDFITPEDLSKVLSDKEAKLLELIVNFRLPLVTDEVCFADIVDDLEVEFSDEIDNDAIRPQSIDRTLLENKLDNLNKQIEKIRNNPQLRNKYDIERMMSAAGKAGLRLQEASGENVEFGVSRLGRFVPGDSPKVVIYYKNIEHISSQRWDVMAGVFIHEMFHAWNYFKARPNSSSVLAIDEPMVEFETLYFLKELKAFTDSQSHPLKDKVSSVSLKTGRLVQNKQQSIGDVAAYGFGYYLFEKLGKSDVESIEWIEIYSKKSASIKNSNKEVKKVKDALIPVYPFMLEAEVMKWFKKIIFDGYTTSVTAGKSAATKTGLPVSLRDLVLACIKTIGRKYFEAKELYAFAPIFEVCVAVPGNMEDALKQQLDELVKDGFLEAFPHDCYVVK